MAETAGTGRKYCGFCLGRFGDIGKSLDHASSSDLGEVSLPLSESAYMVPSEAAYAQADRPQSLPASQEAADEEDEIIFQGNSFLIEEAYNQEPGVVQHVFNFVRGWDEGRGHKLRI